MIVSITGYNGSGKSTLAKGIAKALGLKYYSGGQLLRMVAKEKGLSLMGLHERMEADESLDRMLDEQNKKLGRERDDFVIDSRLAWHFIPKSIKIFVKIDQRKAAERVFGDIKHCRSERNGESESKSVKETLSCLKKRMAMNRARYKRLYNVDYLDEKNYDIVVDTTKTSIEETRKKVLEKIRKMRGK